MKPSERRQQMKQEMADRTQESYNTKDDSGKFKSIFIKEKLGNAARWKSAEGEHFINIIPYIAGANNPTVAKGKFAYYLDIWVHNKVGTNEDSYVCLARSYNKSCAICDHQTHLRNQDDYDEKYVKSLNPSRRAIYNVECLDNNTEMAKKVQYWDASHFSIEKEIAELAKKPRGGGFITFADPDDGKTVFFRRTGSGLSNTKYSGFRFEDRTEPVPDELLDLALCLDECVHIPTYDEVKNAFFGNEIDEEDPRVREESAIDAVVEEQQPIERGPARRTREEVKEEPKEEKKAEEFTCPGDPPKDYNQFKACDTCPDVKDCEKEYNEMKEKEKPVEKEAVKEEVKEPVNEEPARRVRRRPGQDA